MAEPSIMHDHGITPSRTRTAAWVLYDLANTIYIATVTFVFTPFAKEQLGGLTSHGVTNFLSMVAAALLVPFFGALVDTTSRTRRYLTIGTTLCVTALFGWSLDLGPLWLLACYFLANLAYNVALVFYNSLLTSVAEPARAGRVSSLGVGVGYMGTLLVLAITMTWHPSPRTFFAIAAGLFLLLALPCMLLVRDRRKAQASSVPTSTAVREANHRVWRTIRELPRHRPLMWFLIGNFFLVDVLNTAILYFAEFTKSVFAEQASHGIQLFGATFTGQAGIDSFMGIAGICLNVLAMLVGIFIGRWNDKSPLTVMRVSAIALLCALIGGAIFGGNNPLAYLGTLVALGAFGLTGIWSAGRKIIVVLAPPDQIGQYFGLYGITIKLSVFGAVIYSWVSDAYGSKPAMLTQSAQLLIGLLCLFMVRLPKRSASDPAGTP